MKKKHGIVLASILMIILASLLIVAFITFGQAKAATSAGWNVFRTISATDGTELAAATIKTAPVEADDGTIAIMGRRGAMSVIFAGTAADNVTFSWTIWAYKNASSPAEYVANGTGICGLTQQGTADTFYADTLVITDQQWYSTVTVVADCPDAIIATAGIAKLFLDTHEYQFFKIILTKGTATTIGAYYQNYEP